MSTSSNLKLALELAAKVTGREDLAALAGQVQELGPLSDETAAETERLAQTLEGLTQQRDLIAQFEASGRALTQLELATILSRDKLAELRREQQGAAGSARQLTDQERLLASEVKQLERQLIAQHSEVGRLRGGLSQAGIDTRNLAQEQNRLQRELRESAAQTERLGRSLVQGAQGAGGFQGAIGSLTGRLVAMAGTWFGIQTLTTQLMAMFQTGDQAERLSVQLKAVMGSIAGGKEASAWIQDFAKNTPLQLDEVTQVFVRLKAFGIDPMNGSMQGIVDQAYKLGGGFEEVQGISLALGQAWAKQKLQGEEILQLIERGVPVWQLLEQVTGKNTAELQKLSEAGKLGRDTIQALMNEIAAQSSGAAANNMSLLSGLISNAQDNLAKFYRMVAENGALTWLKNQLASLNREFDQMAQDGRLQAWAQRLSDGIVGLGESIKAFIQTVYAWRDALLVMAQAWYGLKIAGWIADLRGLYGQFIALPAATATAAGGHDHGRDGSGRRLYRDASSWDGDQGVAGRRHCRVDIPDHPSGHRPQGVDAGRAGAARIPGAACADPGSAQWPTGCPLCRVGSGYHQHGGSRPPGRRGQGTLRRGHRQLASGGPPPFRRSALRPSRPATTWMRSTPSPGKRRQSSPPRWARQPRPWGWTSSGPMAVSARASRRPSAPWIPWCSTAAPVRRPVRSTWRQRSTRRRTRPRSTR
nr:tape measure protein [Aeromonas caviae]